MSEKNKSKLIEELTYLPVFPELSKLPLRFLAPKETKPSKNTNAQDSKPNEKSANKTGFSSKREASNEAKSNNLKKSLNADAYIKNKSNFVFSTSNTKHSHH
jgi:hypothetical protein